MFFDYYKLLDLQENCTKSEIKKAFRKKIKIYHPDIKDSINSSTKSSIESSEDYGKYQEYNDHAQLLIKAYNVLSCDSLRQEYDAKLDSFNKSQNDKKSEFNYREFLLSQNNVRSYAKLIMYELYCNNDDYALTIYLKYPSCIILYLDRSDMLDCLLMLSEECIRQEKFLESFEILYMIIEYEIKHPYFKDFFDFVLTLLKITIDNIIVRFDIQTSIIRLEAILKVFDMLNNIVDNIIVNSVNSVQNNTQISVNEKANEKTNNKLEDGITCNIPKVKLSKNAKSKKTINSGTNDIVNKQKDYFIQKYIKLYKNYNKNDYYENEITNEITNKIADNEIT